MTEEKDINTNKDDKQTATPRAGVKSEVKPETASAVAGKPVRKARTPFKKNTHFKKNRTDRPRSEFDQKIIKIRRVTRVVKGGRRFSFSVAMVIGNRKGSVGVGVAKGGDVSLAIEKAVRTAKKNLVKLNLTSNKSINYDVEKKYCASVIKLSPTREGKGLSAGSSTKNVLELAGITDVTSKITSRSRNKLNNAMATLKALEEFKISS